MEEIKQIISSTVKELRAFDNVKYSFGYLSNNEESKYLIDKNGVQEFEKYHYEIGSITKLFTGLLISKAIVKKSVSLSDRLDKFFDLKKDIKYPTVLELITHRAGLELEETIKHLPRLNPFLGIGKQQVINELNNYKRTKEEHSFSYSNLGAAITGMILEVVNDKPYHKQVDELIKEIGLKDTYCLNPIRDIEGVNSKGELFGNWDWDKDSVFNAAGCMVSTLSDMLKFGRFILESKNDYVLHMKETKYKEYYKEDDLEVGSFLLKYPKYEMLYHDGGTGCFHSALCMYPKGLVVVSLSNKYLETANNTFKYSYMISKK